MLTNAIHLPAVSPSKQAKGPWHFMLKGQVQNVDSSASKASRMSLHMTALSYPRLQVNPRLHNSFPKYQWNEGKLCFLPAFQDNPDWVAQQVKRLTNIEKVYKAKLFRECSSKRWKPRRESEGSYAGQQKYQNPSVFGWVVSSRLQAA